MNNESRNRYSQEMKGAVFARMMQPNNESVKNISSDTGISKQSLYQQRKKARSSGNATAGIGQTSDRWSSEDKFLVVLETYALNETDLAEYCRKKGLYKEQIDAWRSVCLNASTGELNQTKRLSQELKVEKKRTVEIEKDLCMKEIALAEASALSLLRKKARGSEGDHEDE